MLQLWNFNLSLQLDTLFITDIINFHGVAPASVCKFAKCVAQPLRRGAEVKTVLWLGRLRADSGRFQRSQI